MSLRTMLPLLSLPLLLACAPDVGDGVAAAEVAEPAASPAPTAEGREIAVDTSRSRIHALGAKITATHDIVFDEWEGALRLDDDAVVGLEVTVQMTSLRADAEKLTGHLQSPDFFDVARFPTARFESSSVIAAAGQDGATHRVSGALTMHGVTRQVSFPARLDVSDTVGAKATFVIDRQDFGIAYPGMPDDLIQDDVVLTVDLVADRSAS